MTTLRRVGLAAVVLALLLAAYMAVGGPVPRVSFSDQQAAIAAPNANVPVPPPPTGNEPKLDVSTGDAAMAAKQSAVVPANVTIKGDVMVWDSTANAWKKFFDEGTPDTAKTGALLSLNKEATVYAPFGANVSANRTVPDLEAELKSNGCEGGCTSVTKYTWPEGSTTPARLLAEAPYPGPEPTAQAAEATPVTGTCPQMAYDPGDSVEVPAGCIVLGDVIIAMGTDKQLATDSDAHTGMVTIMNEAATVMFPSGGTVIDPRGREVADIAQQQAQVANLTGCAGAPIGCDVTGIYQFPSGEVEWVKDAATK